MADKAIGILTSGGDAPGMNAAVRACSILAGLQGVRVVGIERGYKGLLEGAFRPLTHGDVEDVFRDGGTLLHSSRCPQFHDAAVRAEARRILKSEGIEGIVVIGGNGSLAGASALGDPEEGGPDTPRVIGVPASIDNDLALTSMSIGVDTAMNTIVEACDKISDTASAHERTFIVEVMGRSCGYLAMVAGIASGADLVLFPEAGKADDEIVDAALAAILARRRRGGRKRTLIVKAEGVTLPTEELKRRLDERLQEEAAQREDFETRVTVLGHVVRGGRPSAFDRVLGTRLGNVAVRALLDGRSRQMVAWMPPTDLGVEAGARSPYDPYCWLVGLDTALRETEKLLSGDSELARWRSSALQGLEEALDLPRGGPLPKPKH